jgi:phage tail sheath gpL-like
MGANAPTCIINYLNTAGAAKATTTFTSTASSTIGSILNTGAAANKYNPFLPLAAGDTGVSDIVSVVWAGTAHASGTVAVCLAKPLWIIPVPATGLYTKVDFVNALPSMRKIPDGANIQFLMFQTGATTTGGTVLVDFDYGWS